MQNGQNSKGESYTVPLMLMRLAVILSAWGLMLAVSGCTTNGGATEYCLISRPILVSKDDVLTDGTVAQVLEHNAIGERLCGW